MPSALPLAVPQVNLLVPVTYLVFWAFLLVFSFISEPMVCGVGMVIVLTGVPIFFLGVFWRSKPKCVHRLTGEPGRGLGGRGIPQPWWPRQARPPPQSPHGVAQASRSYAQREHLPQGPRSPWGPTPGSICRSVCLFSESVTRWGQELCFVVYPQGSPEEEENGPCQPSALPAPGKPLKTQ